MKIYTQETIVNIYDEAENKLSTKKFIAYILYPDDGKLLYDQKDRKVINDYVCVGQKSQCANYTEIDSK